ncbi:hypothetical protein HK102_012146 [Quaeritorhiza haematococci]|nr:hypothetical protein HK102_012146 [Quaeritorhiza haematococci]
MELYKDILQFHMDAEDYPKVILTCKKYGTQDPTLWTQALSYFAEKATLDPTLLSTYGTGSFDTASTGIPATATGTANRELVEVLETIDKKNLLPPLQVIQVLARNPAVTIGMVREYLVRRIEGERKLIEEDQKLIKGYQDETERMRHEIEEIKTQ